jgi:SAM-dependent methyltransferase
MGDDFAARARSFGTVADAYERARPGYPDDAVRWLAGDVPCDVVDLGAGTGKLTRSLVAHGHRVTAVEPSAEMLAQLRAAVPAAVPLEGTGEGDPAARRVRRRRDGRPGVPLVRQARCAP